MKKIFQVKQVNFLAFSQKREGDASHNGES